ncbi:hypothetical protein QVD17_30496 [Tagetes erecta]|uniref:Uncharacterized protein n=1 Tax=Tagetes erecta TaxID=13708 RepID=A0AAD8K821_TARER|nr:hypothetical protein QVD17_30496 [Tagetes erecta]
MSGRPIGATMVDTLDLDILAKAHSYVLFNCSEIDEFRTEHLKIIRHENQKLRELEIQRLHSETFESWFQDNSDTSVGPQLDENMNIELVRVGLKGTIVDNNTLVFGRDEDT